ncbi:hypothetical protein V8G54_019829, partial [Vigna mungo]
VDFAATTSTLSPIFLYAREATVKKKKTGCHLQGYLPSSRLSPIFICRLPKRTSPSPLPANAKNPHRRRLSPSSPLPTTEIATALPLPHRIAVGILIHLHRTTCN